MLPVFWVGAPTPAAGPPLRRFLGSYDHASRQEILKTLGVAHILNVGAQVGLCVPGSPSRPGCLHAVSNPAPHALALPLMPPALPLASCPLQTVPSCQPLYKNSFHYHTVSASPPPFDECYAFLGEAWWGAGRRSAAALPVIGMRARLRAAVCSREPLLRSPRKPCPGPTSSPPSMCLLLP